MASQVYVEEILETQDKYGLSFEQANELLVAWGLSFCPSDDVDSVSRQWNTYRKRYPDAAELWVEAIKHKEDE